MWNILQQLILSFVGTIGFSIIFNVPQKELVFCGIGGAIGWMLYVLVSGNMDDPLLGVFLGAMAVTCVARILSVRRKMPVTIYMIPGIIPLVPGAGIYFTMFHIVIGENNQALLRGIQTLSTAGVIAVGLLIVLSLPRRFLCIMLIDKCVLIDFFSQSAIIKLILVVFS